MALPPERIKIKRRREEDPVEALYAQPKKKRPSALYTRSTDQNGVEGLPSLVPKTPELPPLPNAPSPFPNSTATIALPTNRSADRVHSILFQNIKAKDEEPRFTEEHPALGSIPRPSRSSSKLTNTSPSAAEPRRFHLSHGFSTIPSPHSMSSNGIRKHGTRRREHLAVFEEKSKRMLSQNGLSSTATVDEVPNAIVSQGVTVGFMPCQKRPSATAAEKKWREENWTKPTAPEIASAKATNISSNEWDYVSMELVEELQTTALKEIRANEQRSKDSNGQSKLKYQPKPPKPRPTKSQGNTGRDYIEHRVDSDDDTEYVFDTYIRTSAQLAGAPYSSELYIDPLEGLSKGSIGLLVIEEDDEAIWEAYGDEEVIDEEWNSEEEDENAEDYYGNDYPEDEVNSDDEYGKGAYNYRHGNSDEEEYGEDTPAWSDDEDGSRILTQPRLGIPGNGNSAETKP